jgi:hypothetical protein
VKQKWEKELKRFRDELQLASTDPFIIERLTLGLQHWREVRVMEYKDVLMQHQHKIGWDGVMDGCIGLCWKDQQESYIQQESITQNSNKWSELVVRKLWMIAWEMWQHRNQRENKDDSQRELETLLQEVKKENEIGTHNIRELNILFSNREIAKVLEGTQGYARTWLRNIKARRNWAAKQDESTGMRSMRRILRNFFTCDKNK